MRDTIRGELQTQRSADTAPRNTQTGKIGGSLLGCFNSEYLFIAVAILSALLLFGPVAFDSVCRSIYVDRQGNSITWETSARCPLCNSWSFCNGAGTPYECQKCGHSFTRQTH